MLYCEIQLQKQKFVSCGKPGF